MPEVCETLKYGQCHVQKNQEVQLNRLVLCISGKEGY